MEPENPDKYYELVETKVVDGKIRKTKVKRWLDDEDKCWKEKIISFEEEG